MVRTISQDTFNEIVSENMAIFDMSEEEAIEEAIKQLQAQGVNLTCIMKNTRKAAKIKEDTKKLSDLTADVLSNEKEIISKLESLIVLTKNDLPAKLLAAREGLYRTLKTCVRSDNNSMKDIALEALTSLMDGNPDLLEPDGLSLLLENLNASLPANTLFQALQWLVCCVTKHEVTRAALIQAKAAAKLKEIALAHENNRDVIIGVCSATCVLLQDDDIRVVHGDAHEHARALAADLLPLLIRLLPKFSTDEAVTCDLLVAISSLLVRNEFCIAFHDEGGLKYALDLAVEFPDSEKIAREWFVLLKCLAGSDEVKGPIIASGAAPLIVGAFEKHYKSSNVAVAACMCLAALTLRSPPNALALAASGLPETLVRCMNFWKKNASIMKHGCAAIRNQVSRCPELRAEYVELQVEDVLRLVRDASGNIEFEAKSALLDLGFQVELIEQWRGQGKQLAN